MRVTQDEYQTLDRISRQHGANSVSEFLRERFIHAKSFMAASSAAARDVTQEIEDLKREVDLLSRIVMQIVARQTTRKPGADGIESDARVLAAGNAAATQHP
ncbi:MAG: hypothetical protein ABSC93_11940 [Bryobacteraceae bacterium]|jgi:cell division protein FtsB